MIRNFLAALFISAATFAVAADAPPATRPAAALAEIRSIGELADQPLITLANGDQVRLGIGPIDPEMGPWRVVYCRVERMKAAIKDRSGQFEHGAQFLGPLEVYCRWPTAKSEGLKWTKEGVNASGPPGEHHDFQALVPLLDSGKPVITVAELDGTTVALITLDVPKPIPSPWRAFAAYDFKHAEGRHPNDPHLKVWREPFAMLPDLPEVVGIRAKSADAKIEPPLPALKLSLEHNLFHIDAGDEKMYDDDSLLARFWLNGKLQWPEVSKHDRPSSKARLVRVEKAYDVRFDLPKDLQQAKAGDEVEVQVLYARGGWRYAMDDSHFHSGRADGKGFDLMLSNRLKFVLTDDMLKSANP